MCTSFLCPVRNRGTAKRRVGRGRSMGDELGTDGRVEGRMQLHSACVIPCLWPKKGTHSREQEVEEREEGERTEKGGSGDRLSAKPFILTVGCSCKADALSRENYSLAKISVSGVNRECNNGSHFDLVDFLTPTT